jgi:hypothetical protein
MEREFKCPSCGAANQVTNPGILMKVCDFCKTAIYWDKESALRAGRKSMDLPTSTRFKVGATGKIKGKSFTVLGRLSYAHEKGVWDEWFIEMSDGKIRWLAEDEGELFLEEAMQLMTPVPPVDELEPGMQIVLNDTLGIVEEIGEATCMGGEGQIPFEVEIGEVYPYVDGTAPDGSFIFGLEYDSEEGPPRAFKGQALSVKDGKSGAGAHAHERTESGEVVRCASCGKPYEGKRVDSTEMIVCDACGANLQLDEAETRVIGQNSGKGPYFTFPIGTPITINKVKYEVMGRLLYVETDEGIEYPSFEYTLYNPETGYLWLAQEQGHFTISAPYHMRAVIPASSIPRVKVRIDKEEFRVYEQGTVTLKWVDGALPWVAKVGEKTRYTHLIKPPECVDREITDREMELFRGRYVSHEELKRGIPDDINLPTKSGIGSCEPYTPSPWVKGTGIIGGIFLLVNIVMLIFSFMADRGNVVLQEKIDASSYKKEYLSQPFEINVNGSIVRLTGYAPLANSWVALDFALVNENDQVIGEFYDEASYYYGRDSEGKWTEGAQDFTTHFWVENAGTYRLLVHGQGGSGYKGPSRNENISLVLEEGATISWYFIFPILLAIFIAVLGKLSKWTFETRRWSQVMEGDD